MIIKNKVMLFSFGIFYTICTSICNTFLLSAGGCAASEAGCSGVLAEACALSVRAVSIAGALAR